MVDVVHDPTDLTVTATLAPEKLSRRRRKQRVSPSARLVLIKVTYDLREMALKGARTVPERIWIEKAWDDACASRLVDEKTHRPHRQDTAALYRELERP